MRSTTTRKGYPLKVLVLGSGPAGLVASHAAATAGASVEIVSLGRRSPLHGAQYLHEPIPGVPGIQHRTITTTLYGTVDGYRRKVYGDAWKGTVSPEQFTGKAEAWDIRATYDWLWDTYSGAITPCPLDGEMLPRFIPLAEFDVVFSTIPADRLCINPSHTFGVQNVWAAGDAPEWRLVCPVRPQPETISLNGYETEGWYRGSNVFDHCTAEWPWRKGRKPPIEGIASVKKPLSTNCDCWPNIIRLGRYGKWAKGELVHTVYSEAAAALTSRVG